MPDPRPESPAGATWHDLDEAAAPTLVVDERGPAAPTLAPADLADAAPAGPTLAPPSIDGRVRPAAPAETTEARVTVLPEIVSVGDRASLRTRTEPRFKPLGAAGHGGLGEVVIALDQDIGRKVAIKRIRHDRVSPGAVLRFVQEIRTVGRLEHANIVPIHDVGRDASGALYFVMRYVEGETLETIIGKLRAGDAATHRAYGFERRVQVIAAVLDALAFAHAHGIVHRDLKPANIMVGPYGEVMLLDWGIARVEAQVPAEGQGQAVGTPLYMSPEQARGEKVDARSDLYSISVVLHELLTLRHYLEDCETTEATLRGVLERPVPKAALTGSKVQPQLPMDLTWFVDQGVQKDPARRYPSAQAMLDRLAARAEGDVPVQCHVTFTQRILSRTMRQVNRHPVLAAFGLVGGAAGVVSGLAWAVVG